MPSYLLQSHPTRAVRGTPWPRVPGDDVPGVPDALGFVVPGPGGVMPGGDAPGDVSSDVSSDVPRRLPTGGGGPVAWPSPGDGLPTVYQPPSGYVLRPAPLRGRLLAAGGVAAAVVALAFVGVFLAGLLFPAPPQQPDERVQARAEAPPLPVPVDPDSPYPVYGSQDMVRYLAQSMIKHEDTVDLSAYQLDDAAKAEDALLEAVTQNPYVVDVRSYGCVPESCRIGYGYSAAAQAAIQEQLLTTSTSILAQTVDPSMSDADKVRAIDRWLTRNARYDDEAAALLAAHPEPGFDPPDAYRYAWNASGVLLDGKGVCESYAEAFDLLANAAGVPTVVVSGYLDADHAPHAWNKVYVAGGWKAVDVTWDHGPPITTDYLMIDDSQFTGEAARTEDDQWMIDSLIPTYATS